jgi:hypothetical protein
MKFYLNLIIILCQFFTNKYNFILKKKKYIDKIYEFMIHYILEQLS